MAKNVKNGKYKKCGKIQKWQKYKNGKKCSKIKKTKFSKNQKNVKHVFPFSTIFHHFFVFLSFLSFFEILIFWFFEFLYFSIFEFLNFWIFENLKFWFFWFFDFFLRFWFFDMFCQFLFFCIIFCIFYHFFFFFENFVFLNFWRITRILCELKSQCRTAAWTWVRRVELEERMPNRVFWRGARLPCAVSFVVDWPCRSNLFHGYLERSALDFGAVVQLDGTLWIWLWSAYFEPCDCLSAAHCTNKTAETKQSHPSHQQEERTSPTWTKQQSGHEMWRVFERQSLAMRRLVIVIMDRSVRRFFSRPCSDSSTSIKWECFFCKCWFWWSCRGPTVP